MNETWPFARLLTDTAQTAAAFRSTAGEQPHRPARNYLDLLRAFEEATPETGTPASAVLSALLARAESGLHGTVGPRFFGWVMGGSHPVGVAADWLASAWGQNAGNHTASPAAAAAETVSARWLLDILRLPPEASVGFVTGATVANFVCLAAARGEVLRRTGWDIDAQGLFGAPPIAIPDRRGCPLDRLLRPPVPRLRASADAADRDGSARRDAPRRICTGPYALLGADHRHHPGRSDQHRLLRPAF